MPCDHHEFLSTRAAARGRVLRAGPAPSWSRIAIAGVAWTALALASSVVFDWTSLHATPTPAQLRLERWALADALALGGLVLFVIGLSGCRKGRRARVAIGARALLLLVPLSVAWVWEAWQPGLGAVGVDWGIGGTRGTSIPRRFDAAHLWLAAMLPLHAHAALIASGRAPAARWLRRVTVATLVAPGALAVPGALVVLAYWLHVPRGVVGDPFLLVMLAWAALALAPFVLTAASVTASLALTRWSLPTVAAVVAPSLGLVLSACALAARHGAVTHPPAWPLRYLIVGAGACLIGFVLAERNGGEPRLSTSAARRP